MKTAVVRTGAGNLFSLVAALERLGETPMIVDSPAQLMTAQRVILPGVGEARSAMAFLAERGLDVALKGVSVPVLGICLGMQLLCRESEEGRTPGLSVFDVAVKRFYGEEKVPHTGWNRVGALGGELFTGIPQGEWFYFVHSFRVDICGWTMAHCRYMGDFSAALAKQNFFGVQFHPEKSGAWGSRLLENFCRLGGNINEQR